MADSDTDSPIPQSVRQLLRDHIETYEQLETLLLLQRDRDRTWSEGNVQAALKLSLEAAAAALDHLCRRNLIKLRSSGSQRLFHYDPGRPESDEAVLRLAREFDENQLEIIKLMSAYAIDRIRTSAIRAFADAFLRRGSGSNG